MMTPEERYTRMENLVHSVIEAQAHLTEAQAQSHAQLSERQEKQQRLIEEDRAAIRDLIAVSRAVIEAQKQTAAMLQALQETVREHEGRIEALIDTVDRIIRRDQPPS